MGRLVRFCRVRQCTSYDFILVDFVWCRIYTANLLHFFAFEPHIDVCEWVCTAYSEWEHMKKLNHTNTYYAYRKTVRAQEQWYSSSRSTQCAVNKIRNNKRFGCSFKFSSVYHDPRSHLDGQIFQLHFTRLGQTNRVKQNLQSTIKVYVFVRRFKSSNWKFSLRIVGAAVFFKK